MTALALALAVFMGGSGLAHFLLPRYFRGLVPSWVPRPSAVVVLAGLANIAVAALLSVPTTRSWGGWATAALITAYLPAHLDAVRGIRGATRPYDRTPGVVARIAVNLGYIAWAAAVGVLA